MCDCADLAVTKLYGAGQLPPCGCRVALSPTPSELRPWRPSSRANLTRRREGARVTRGAVAVTEREVLYLDSTTGAFLSHESVPS